MQQPLFENQKALLHVINKLKTKKALLHVNEIQKIKKLYNDVSKNKAFILQGGDCAEEINAQSTQNAQALKNLLEKMASIIEQKSRKKVLKIGRVAGQYAKPRSKATESKNGISLPSYFGDIINSYEWDKTSREPDPYRMLSAYETALKTYEAVKEDDFFISHEALLLAYESVFVQEGCSLMAHTLWIGNKTRSPNGAHVKFASEISNPVGIKIDADVDVWELKKTIQKINPKNHAGKINIISRMGAKKIKNALPDATNELKDLRVIWSVDAMHGNTYISANGLKTRDMHDIKDEIKSFYEICKASGVVMGGVHLEMCALDVSECIDGARIKNESDLQKNYKSKCDPRLNYEQSLDLAHFIAHCEEHFAQG